MSDEKTSRTLTQEEYERIMALPIREMSSGGITYRGKYDESTSRFYSIDDSGNLDGRTAVITRKDRPPEDTSDNVQTKASGIASTLRRFAGATDEEINKTVKKPSKPPNDQDNPKPEVNFEPQNSAKSSELDKAPETDPEAESKGKKKKRTLKAVFIAVAAVAVIILAVLAYLMEFPAKVDLPSKPSEPTQGVSDITPEPTKPPIPSATPNVTDEPPSLETIEVLQVTRDLIPGDIITEADVQCATISAETYNTIYLGQSQLYQWTRYESLLNKSVVSFIPQGQYLTYDNVASEYYQSPNPWRNGSDSSTFVNVPLPKELASDWLVNYGSIVNLTIERLTIKEIIPGEGDEVDPITAVAGLEHQTSVQQSYVVDKYGLPNVVICDLLDATQTSLYSTYTSWSEIPTGEQLAYIRNRLMREDDLLDKITPAYICIKLTNSQAEELGDLTGDNITVTYELTENTDTSSEAKTLYAAEARAITQTISKAIAINNGTEAEEDMESQ